MLEFLDDPRVTAVCRNGSLFEIRISHGAYRVSLSEQGTGLWWVFNADTGAPVGGADGYRSAFYADRLADFEYPWQPGFGSAEEAANAVLACDGLEAP